MFFPLIRADPRERIEAPPSLHEGMERLLGMAPVEPYNAPIASKF